MRDFKGYELVSGKWDGMQEKVIYALEPGISP